MSNDQQTTALTVATSTAMVDPRAAAACRNPEDVWRLAGSMATAGLCKSQEEGFVRLSFGMELGLSATSALRATYVVDNRVSLYAEYIAGIIQSHREVCEYFEVVESTREVATYRCKRVGRPELVMSYTIEDARGADLLKKANWKANPRAMLRARCTSELGRAQFADLTAGLYTADEIEEQTAHGWTEPEVKTIVTRVDAPTAQSKPESPVKDATDAKPSEPTKAAPVAVNGAATPAANGNAAPAATFDAAKFMTSLENAIKGATTLAKLDAIFGTFEKRRAQLSAENDDAAVAMFANARARVEGASVGAAQ